MVRKILTSLVFAGLICFGALGMSEAQGENSFVGQWQLTISFPPPSPQLEYLIMAGPAPANEFFGLDSTDRRERGASLGRRTCVQDLPAASLD